MSFSHRLEALFEIHLTDKYTRSIGRYNVSWCLDSSYDYSPGYLKMNRLGLKCSSFINATLGGWVPFVWKRIIRSIMERYLSYYEPKIETFSEDIKTSFHYFTQDLYPLLFSHWHTLRKWTFPELASFLSEALLLFLDTHKISHDLFQEDKRIQNNYSIAMYQELRTLLSEDQLDFSFLCYLITRSNWIDNYEKNANEFALTFTEDINDYLSESSDWFKELIDSSALFEYRSLKFDVYSSPKTFLYECDNHGEIFYDCLMIECILKQGHSVILSSRKGPILNDVSFDDLTTLFKSPQLDHFRDYLNSGQLKLIHNGTSDVVKRLSHISDEYKTAYKTADIIIIKGQGHYESFPRYRQKWFMTFKTNYKKPHYHIFSVKSRLIQYSLTKLHRKKIPIGSLYLKYFH